MQPVWLVCNTVTDSNSNTAYAASMVCKAESNTHTDTDTVMQPAQYATLSVSHSYAASISMQH